MSFSNKLDTLEYCSTGVTYSCQGEFDKALMNFNQVLMENPEDYLAKGLLSKVDLYAADGAPPGWKGVEMMETR